MSHEMKNNPNNEITNVAMLDASLMPPNSWPKFRSSAERALYMLGAYRFANVEASGKEAEFASLLTDHCLQTGEVHCFSGLVATSKTFNAAVIDALNVLPVPAVEGTDRHGRGYTLVANTPSDRFLSATRRCHNCGSSWRWLMCNIDAMVDDSHISIFLCQTCVVSNQRVRYGVHDCVPRRYNGTIDGNVMVQYLPRPDYVIHKYPFDERAMSDVCGATFHIGNLGHERHFFYRVDGCAVSPSLAAINLAPHLREPLKALELRLAAGEAREEQLYQQMTKEVQRAVAAHGLPAMDSILPETWKQACGLLERNRPEDWHLTAFLSEMSYAIRRYEPRHDETTSPGAYGHTCSRNFILKSDAPRIAVLARQAWQAYRCHSDLHWLCRGDHWTELQAKWPPTARALVDGQFQVACISRACWQCTRGVHSGTKEVAVELLYRIRGMFSGNTARIVTSEAVACAALNIAALGEVLDGRWVTVADVKVISALFLNDDDGPVVMIGHQNDLIFNLSTGTTRKKKKCAHSTYKMALLRSPRLVWCSACARCDV